MSIISQWMNVWRTVCTWVSFYRVYKKGKIFLSRPVHALHSPPITEKEAWMTYVKLSVEVRASMILMSIPESGAASPVSSCSSVRPRKGQLLLAATLRCRPPKSEYWCKRSGRRRGVVIVFLPSIHHPLPSRLWVRECSLYWWWWTDDDTLWYEWYQWLSINSNNYNSRRKKYPPWV